MVHFIEAWLAPYVPRGGESDEAPALRESGPTCAREGDTDERLLKLATVNVADQTVAI
jgi:hypothetical protein